MTYSKKQRSNAWVLLPIFFGVIGGIIAFFIIRGDDPRKAKNCLWLGIILSVSYVGYYIVFYVMIEMFDSV